MNSFESSYEMRQLADNWYLISRGLRSAYLGHIEGSIEPIFDDDISLSDKLKMLEEEAASWGLNFYAYEKIADNLLPGEKLYIFWVYKFKHQEILIKMLPHDGSILEEYIIGKLLGYSDESMEEFLDKNFDMETLDRK